MGTIRLPPNGGPVPRATAAPDYRHWSVYIPCGAPGSAGLYLGQFTRRPGPVRRFFQRYLLGLLWVPTQPAYPKPPGRPGRPR